MCVYVVKMCVCVCVCVRACARVCVRYVQCKFHQVSKPLTSHPLHSPNAQTCPRPLPTRSNVNHDILMPCLAWLKSDLPKDLSVC